MTLHEKIAAKIEAIKTEMREKTEKKIKEETLKEILFDLTGIEFMVLIHEGKNHNDLSIWAENDSWNTKFDRSKLAEYYKEICSLFTPVNSVIKTSNGETKTFAPCEMYFDNNTSDIVWNHTQTVKIDFTFDGGLDYKCITVSFKMPANRNFSNDLLEEREYKRKMPFGRNSRKQVYSIDMFGKINMYGNCSYCYCDTVENYDEFMSVVMTGHVPEFSEGFNNGNIS